MITFTFKDSPEAQAVIALIGKCPYEQVAELIDRLKRELKEQTEPKPDAPAG